MKRFFFFVFLSAFNGLSAQSGDSLQRKSQYHVDASVYTMMPLVYGPKLEPYTPGFRLSYGEIRHRNSNKFRDWEISAGMTHLQSPMLPVYSTPSGHYYNYQPWALPVLLGYNRYKYHFGEVAFQYRFGRNAENSKSDFYWSWGPMMQLVFLQSYRPIKQPGVYSGLQLNRYGNMVVTDFTWPGFGVACEAGFLAGAADKKFRYRISVFGNVQLTPSFWRLPYDVPGWHYSTFPVAAGLRAGIVSNKKAVRDSSGTFLPQYVPKNRFIAYSEILGASFGISANLEVKIIESDDRLFALYGRAGVSYSIFGPGTGIAGIHSTFGRRRIQLDAGAVFNTLSQEESWALSLGVRYSGKKGLFIRPAYTPFYDGAFNSYSGISAGYSWSSKKKKKP